MFVVAIAEWATYLLGFYSEYDKIPLIYNKLEKVSVVTTVFWKGVCKKQDRNSSSLLITPKNNWNLEHGAWMFLDVRAKIKLKI